MNRRLRLAYTAVGIGILAFMSACAASDTPVVHLNGIPIAVEIADDEAERTHGLQDHEALHAGEGMLFVFEDVAPRTFAMKDVSFPIDVLFFDESLRVSAVEPLDPGDAHVVTSPGPSPYVLELPQGWAAEQGLGPGAALEVEE